MDKKEAIRDVIRGAKVAYQKGYSEGFTDACNLMKKAAGDLVESINEALTTSESTGNASGEKLK